MDFKKLQKEEKNKMSNEFKDWLIDELEEATTALHTIYKILQKGTKKEAMKYIETFFEEREIK